MKQRLLSLVLSLLLAVSTAMAAPLTTPASSPYETATPLATVAATDWMSAIRGETKLTEITIPGTHDSCARKFKQSIYESVAKCQSLNITEQLNAGVRFLDVRCEVDASTHSIKTVHGSMDCWNGNDYYYLDFVFQDLYNWLAAHPSETVLVCIKEDDGNVGAPTFTSAVYEYIHGYGQNKYFYGEDYNYTDHWYLGKSVPTLDAVRGKCVLMNRFDQVIASSGSTASEEESGQKIKWGDYSDTSYTTPVYANVTNTNTGIGTFHVQDHYKWSTQNKINATQAMLSLGHWRGEYYFNYSSTVSDSTIPNPQNLANTVNAAYPNFTYQLDKPSGIFAMDFATEELARYIIKNNEAVANIISGTDGNITYTINRLTGTLTVGGNGAMNDYTLDSNSGIKNTGTTAPWSDQIKNCLFDGQYNTDIIRRIVVGDGVTYIGNYAFYGFDHLESISLPNNVTIGTDAVPDYVNTGFYSINAKAGNSSRAASNPFAGKDLTAGVTIEYTQKCDTDRGWNNALMTFSTGNNADNRYFILMTNGTILFNDGNGGLGGNNNCYFDLNSSAAVNTTGRGWVHIKILIYKNDFGEHLLDYYINNVLAKSYNINENCASGYPYGVSGNDGIFSFLGANDIKLYYGAAYNIYNMGGTTDCYLDSVRLLDYIENDVSAYRVYENTFTDSLGGEAHTGTADGGYSVYHQTTDQYGRSGTAYFPYSGENEATTNYVSTGVSPFAGTVTDNGYTIAFWQRINGNYWGNRESITLAQGSIGEKKYFTVGTDGYLRFNNGNGGSDASLSGAGLYFDYTTACGAIQKQQWQFITVEMLDDQTLKYYVNGVLQKTITAGGTDNYILNGGMMRFLNNANTKLYFGSYTPYWGTPTLSLDNVTCYRKALTDAEVMALYASETAGHGMEDDFLTAPQTVSGSITHLESYDGRNGVLYIPTCSADGEIAVYINGTQTSNLDAIAENTAVELRYTGSGTVREWRVTDADGTHTYTDTVCTFTLTSDTKVDVSLVYTGLADTSALQAAIALAGTYAKPDYSPDSYAVLATAVEQGETMLLSNTQSEVDAATADILSAIHDLVPYLTLTLESMTGGTVRLSYDGLTAMTEDGIYHPLFGTRIKMRAEPGRSFRFAGWFETKSKRILSTDTEYIFDLSSNTDIRPLFIHLSASTVTFMNTTGYIAGIISKTPEEWAAVTKLGPLSPAVPFHYGGTNGHWDYDNEATLARLAAGEDVTLYAVYDERETAEPTVPVPSENVPVLTLTLDLNNQSFVGTYLMALGVPEGCTVVEKGIALKYSASDSFHPDDFILTLDNKTTTSKFDTDEDSGVFTLNVRRFTHYSWAARAYCTYYDGDGVLRVAYSEQVNYG